MMVLLNGCLRIYRRHRREQEMMQSDVVEEIIYGLESGILFGVAFVVSKMGFVFFEQGFSRMLIPICISIGMCCSGSGFYYQTRGLKHGRAIVVSTCAAVASIVTGVLAGMITLGEHLPSAPTSRLLLLLGWCYHVSKFETAAQVPSEVNATSCTKQCQLEEIWNHARKGFEPTCSYPSSYITSFIITFF